MTMLAEQKAQMSQMSPGSTEKYIYNSIGGRTLNPYYTAPTSQPSSSNVGATVNMNDGSVRYRTATGGLSTMLPTSSTPYADSDPTAQEFGQGGPMSTQFNSQVTGASAIGDDAYNEQQRMLLADKLSRERMASLSGMMGDTAARVQMPGGPDETAARSAAFARAKEQAGSTARSALMSLQGAIDERGMTGSSVEAGQAGGVIGGAANSVGDFTREQLIQDLNRASQIADMRYQGDITQRGQDMNRTQTLMGLMAGAAY